MKISVCCPSYKRDKILTFNYLPFVKAYVSPEEYEKYKKANEGYTIIKCRKGIQGNLCRVRNYMLRKEFRSGADVVLLIDDDLRGVSYWEGKKRYSVLAEEFLNFIKKYSIIAQDLGVYFWGINIKDDKQNYREYTPFSLSSYIGGPFQCFLKGNNCWYDERLYLKEDYDMTLQQLNRNRKVLRINKYFYTCKQSEQEGDCAAQRNMKIESDQFKLLQKKWGSQIVKRDESNRSHNLKKKKKHKDYNPIIKAPIRGI